MKKIALITNYNITEKLTAALTVAGNLYNSMPLTILQALKFIIPDTFNRDSAITGLIQIGIENKFHFADVFLTAEIKLKPLRQSGRRNPSPSGSSTIPSIRKIP